MLRQEINKYLKSEFARNSALLVSGNIIGQGIAMLAYIILARLYSDEDIGIFSYFLSITSLLTICSTACYGEAFLVTKNEKEELSLLSLVCRILVVFSVVLFLFLWLFSNYLPSIFKVESVAQYWYFIPLMVFFSSFFAFLTKLANRERQYKMMTTANLGLNIESSVMKVLFGIFTLGGFGLILANVIAQATASLSYHKLYVKFRKLFSCRKELSIKKIASKYRAFPLYTLPRNFINSFSGNLPFFLLTAVFGEAKLGLFSMSLTFCFRPVNLLSNSIYQVFFEKIARLKMENKSIVYFVKKFLIRIFLFALPAFVVAFLLAPFFFKTFLGEKWAEAADYFRYLLPWIMMVLITTSIECIPIVLKKQHKTLWIELLYLASRLAALYIGISMDSFKLAVALFSGVGFLFMSGNLIWYFFLIKNYEKTRSFVS